jgi:transposase InsO family protein
MSQDDSMTKVYIPQLDIGVQYQNWRLSIEGALMTKGLIKYIREAIPNNSDPPELTKRTQAFGIILSFISFSERMASGDIIASDEHDAYALWNDIKDRHEKVNISRVWAYWRRLNAPPDTTLSDPAAINKWFTDTVAAYNAYKTSGRQIDEYTACMIMLDNLPEMWDTMRRSLTQAGNEGNTMTFAVLRRNMENELITRKPQQSTTESDASQALVAMRAFDKQQSGNRPSKRPRLKYQRTPGATCNRCKKPNHTAQQCGKTVDDPEQQTDGTIQLATSTARSRTVVLPGHSTNANHDLFDHDYDSDQEIHMTTDNNDRDDSSALATTKDSDIEPPSRHWLVDCGASYSYCNDRSLLSHVRRCNTAVKLGNGQRLPVIAEGEVTLLLPPHGRKLTITARYVPELRRNLLSAGALGRQGVHVLCAGPRAHIFHAQSGHMIGQARCINEGAEYNLYRIDPIHDTSPLHTAALVCQSNTDTEHDTVSLWHRRLGHSSVRRVRHLFAPGTTADGHALQTRIRPETPKVQPDRHCDTCAICKHHAAPRPLSVPDESRAKRPLETVHIDLRGPHSPGINQELYQLLIVDEYTHYAVGFTLKNKSDALACFERFATAANTFHSAKGCSITSIRSDNGTEFVGKDWTPLLTRLGIQRQRTSPYTPHQNGIVERLNRTIGESTRAMLHAAGLPSRFWPLACQTAVYLNNRLPSKATGNITPYQLWHNKRPSIGHIRVFGCLAYAMIHNPGKLEDKATRCTFVGYPLDSSRTYLLWNNQQQKLTRSGQVHFIESIMGFNYSPKATAGEDAKAGEAAAGEDQVSRALMNSTSAHPTDAASTPAQLPVDISLTTDSSDDQKQPQSMQLNRSQQRQLRRLQDRLSSAVNDAAPAAQVTNAMLQSVRPQLRTGPNRHHYYGSVHAAQQASDDDEEEPRTYQEAMKSPHREEWLTAIRNELKSLIKAGTWRYAHKPAAANLVGCKWIFKIKRDKDGNISKFKARLVAQGFTQVYGIDYAETYAPVARYSSIRLIIALAAHYDWELHQLDVKTAYLNGELDVPIYMRAPEAWG